MDRNEFGERARAIQTRLYRVALAVLSRPEDAQDAVQEALVRAWASLPSLKDEAYFETWLTRIVINGSRSILRERKKRPSLELSESITAETENAPDPDLRRALETLDARFRLALVMRYVLDMPIGEVAKALGITYGAAKWRIHRAKTLARQYYERGGSEL